MVPKRKDLKEMFEKWLRKRSGRVEEGLEFPGF